MHEIILLRNKILQWYRKNARPLPWRKTKEPYFIWLSEIILQQTQIEQGTKYYLQFINTFPTVQNLANATETEVLKLWEGLGYYTRARNLLKTAKIVVSQYNGQFPTSYSELLKLPGIGPYTASAISSICFNQPIPTIDGNVRRVLSRLFEIKGLQGSIEFEDTVQDCANRLVSHRFPGDFNQALMDLGSTICKPTNPSCYICPVKKYCLAHKHGKEQLLPEKKKKSAMPVLNWAVAILINKENILLKQEKEQNFLKGLYALPWLDIKNNRGMMLVQKRLTRWVKSLGIKCNCKWTYLFQHERKYSHRIIHFYVFKGVLNREGQHNEIALSYLWIPLRDLNQIPFSRAFLEIIEKAIL
ncbi:MAG: A/G-specific adenine glycosylase [Candidatus Hydrogenedens sp.]|nr:A/G-specific adenine glycosylase [Candidatus Hydrogenedens sp.]